MDDRRIVGWRVRGSAKEWIFFADRSERFPAPLLLLRGPQAKGVTTAAFRSFKFR
jgi:hypothetical protein